ncbi:MAG: hypothetical protein GY947_20690 [Rhodobacteraceae bacterium]|nr:hypothetical protein [Paracoccaceae bacterium]
MKAEQLLYAGFACVALVSTAWALQLYVNGPQYPEALAFNEYSTIDDPLYRPRDIVRIEQQNYEGELITGSIPKPGNPSKAIRRNIPRYNIVGVYDQMAIVKSRSGKIWTLVPGAQLPEVGIVLKVEATEGHWILTGTHGVVATARSEQK